MTEKNLPFDDACELAKYAMEKGFNTYQKFTCVKCGNRLTMDEPNTFYESGSCDNCGTVTTIEKCGFMAISA